MARSTEPGEEDFAARLLLALQALNISRGQLSATLGVDKSLISRWLSGQARPTNYNLARVSAEFARLKPGFNMTLWAAPRREFEAVLGLASAATAPVPSELSHPDTTAKIVPLAKGDSLRRAGATWAAGLGAVAATMVLAVGFWAVWDRTPRVASRAEQARAMPMASVAVLPFVNMSGDPAKEYLGEGISEEILNDLANTPDLRVPSQTSSFSFKSKSGDIALIARALNVRSVVEGSVRQEGERVRIVAHLIDGASGYSLWSASYDRNVKDVLVVQDEIARAIVAALTQKLLPIRERRSIDPRAYQDYLQAQYFFNQRTGPASERADEFLKDALARQPDFAAAYALRGHVLMLFAGSDSKLWAESLRMTATALRLDPDDQEAIDTDIQAQLRTWNWSAADRDGRQLLARTQHDATTENGIAFYYQYMGFPDQALEARRQAAELDPLLFSYRNNLVLALSHVGRVQDAIAAGQAALELQPGHASVLGELCGLYARAGRIEQAKDHERRLAAQGAIAPPTSASDKRDYAMRNCELQIALDTLPLERVHALLDATKRADFGPSELGVLYARAGDFTQAMKLFSQAYMEREQALIWVRYDSGTPKALLNDPRWLALWRQPMLANWQSLHDRIATDVASHRL